MNITQATAEQLETVIEEGMTYDGRMQPDYTNSFSIAAACRELIRREKANQELRLGAKAV